MTDNLVNLMPIFVFLHILKAARFTHDYWISEGAGH